MPADGSLAPGRPDRLLIASSILSRAFRRGREAPRGKPWHGDKRGNAQAIVIAVLEAFFPQDIGSVDIFKNTTMVLFHNQLFKIGLKDIKKN